jgi:ATP-dependent DNA ligase
MALPLIPPIAPQLARPRADLPRDEGWAYEPKWDGFRALAFVDGGELTLHSRNGRDLRRYFPELSFPAGRYVLDGEIVVFAGGAGPVDPTRTQDFDALGQRIHPARSRIERLAAETPAQFIAFDVLARGDESLLELPLAERRSALEEVVESPVELTPCTRDPERAEPWLRSGEGVIAKQLDAPYRPGERTGMVKIKRVRTMDAVVRGWRPGKEEGTLGALILGLYDEHGELREIGHTSGFKKAEKRELPARLKPYETGERGSGEPSRWTQGRDLEWVALRPELVVEVSFDHVSAHRIRHGAKLIRWREDKDPRECTIDQLFA